ncbi:MAG: zf-HC2 domain-containing protein [Vicinamibacterales bacterium]
MKTLTCAAARRRLDAFHDQELPVHEQIAVSAHLDWCDDCAAVSADLRTIGAAIRVAAPGRVLTAANETAGVRAASVVSRLKAERALPWLPRLQLMCEDMNLVCASFGATVAALVCVASLFGMTRLTAAERPDSLAGIVSVMVMQGECDAVADAAAVSECAARFAERFQRSTESAEEDAVFALDTLLINQGHLRTLASLKASRQDTASGQAKLIEELIDTVSRARLESPRVAGVLWLVTDTTVRASKPSPADQQIAPTAKKRAAALPPQILIRNS